MAAGRRRVDGGCAADGRVVGGIALLIDKLVDAAVHFPRDEAAAIGQASHAGTVCDADPHHHRERRARCEQGGGIDHVLEALREQLRALGQGEARAGEDDGVVRAVRRGEGGRLGGAVGDDRGARGHRDDNHLKPRHRHAREVELALAGEGQRVEAFAAVEGAELREVRRADLDRVVAVPRLKELEAAQQGKGEGEVPGEALSVAADEGDLVASACAPLEFVFAIQRADADQDSIRACRPRHVVVAGGEGELRHLGLRSWIGCAECRPPAPEDRPAPACIR